MSIGATAVKPVVEAKAAVERFLETMEGAAKKTFPAWQKKLIEGLDDCDLSYDVQHALIDGHPIDDYYYAGAVALEAAKIRRLFAPDEASELLSLIGEQVDAAAGRSDRLVSDLTFFIIGRLDQAALVDKHKLPHDQVVKALLQKLGIDRTEETMHLMREVLYRHELGEPLALGVPQWWQLFRSKYSLAGKPETAPMSSPAFAAAEQRIKPRRPRKAVAII
ncbi:MAG: hypothetical protein AB7E79_00100 [Rhodospirillaceae bacterium]